MITARRLKRNFRRVLLPIETVLFAVAGALGLGFYWLCHLAASSARLVATLLTYWRG